MLRSRTEVDQDAQAGQGAPPAGDGGPGQTSPCSHHVGTQSPPPERPGSCPESGPAAKPATGRTPATAKDPADREATRKLRREEARRARPRPSGRREPMGAQSRPARPAHARTPASRVLSRPWGGGVTYQPRHHPSDLGLLSAHKGPECWPVRGFGEDSRIRLGALAYPRWDFGLVPSL